MRKDKGITDMGMVSGQEDDNDTNDDEAGYQSSSTELKASMPYLTDEKGSAIEDWRASNIRNTAANCWLDILYHKELKAPHKWTRIEPNSKRFYYHVLEGKCPEVGYCANHWKADEIAIRNYPNFHKKYEDEITAQWPVGDVRGLNPGKKRARGLTRIRSNPGKKRQRHNYPALPNPL